MHYHIRWSKSLDYEPFETEEAAKQAATQLVLPGEEYSIEQFESDCPKCAEFKKGWGRQHKF